MKPKLVLWNCWRCSIARNSNFSASQRRKNGRNGNKEMIARHKTQFLQIIFLLLGFFTLIQFKWACAGSQPCLARKLSRELIQSSQRRTQPKSRPRETFELVECKERIFRQAICFIYLFHAAVGRKCWTHSKKRRRKRNFESFVSHFFWKKSWWWESMEFSTFSLPSALHLAFDSGWV